MKVIIMMLMSLLLVGCPASYRTAEETNNCLGLLGSRYPTFREGVKSATQKVRIEYKKPFLKPEYADDVKYLSACNLTCKQRHTKYTLETSTAILFLSGGGFPDGVCVPDPVECKKVKIKRNSSIGLYTRGNATDYYEYIDDPECESEFYCDEGYSINDTDEDSPECVLNETDCSVEELGEGGQSGTKTWDDQNKEYNACVISECKYGYDLKNNTCELVEVQGCMASSATNYNSQATVPDNSCICEEGYSYDSEQVACTPNEMSCEPDEYYDEFTMQCEPDMI